MAKKLILLILVVPIIVMVALFAFKETVSLLIDTPVDKIVLIGEETATELNMDAGHTYSLEYAVYPTAASNKEVTVYTAPIEGEDLASLEFDPKDGKILITPRSAGAARVFVKTKDGGHEIFFDVYVRSSRLQSIDATIDKSELFLDKTAEDAKAIITTSFSPKNPSNTILNYVSSDETVATVDDFGIVTAKAPGTATITVISDFNEKITDSVTVTVRLDAPIGLGEKEIIDFAKPGSIPIYFSNMVTPTAEQLSYRITALDGTEIPNSSISASFTLNGNSALLNYTFNDPEFYGEAIISVIFKYGSSEIVQDCKISVLRDIQLSFNRDTAYEIIGLTDVTIPFSVLPADAREDYIYTVTASNGNISAGISNNKRINVNSKYAGVTTLELTATNKLDPTKTQSVSIDVVVKPTTFTIREASVKYGDEKKLAIGEYRYIYGTDNNGVRVPVKISESFSLTYSILEFPTNPQGDSFGAHVSWTSSQPDDVIIDKNGTISFAEVSTFKGDVVFSAVFSHSGAVMKTLDFTVTCIAGGINVYSYEDIYYATTETEIQALKNEDGSAKTDKSGNIISSIVPAKNNIILMTDIEEDFGFINGKYEEKYTTIETTYDKTYYTNIGRSDEATVKILLEFRGDLYGNGHVINAHNVTYRLVKDENGKIQYDDNGRVKQNPSALFQGPLDFVVMREDNGATTSVKAQDNICFALYDGVTVRNVQLRGCTLEPNKDKKTDLTHLNYIGTTVEVLGDNVTLAYSRINNGRTVLRVFGAAERNETIITDKDQNVVGHTVEHINKSDKPITVNITNSVLSSAREFIMRIGSNRFVSDANNPTPSLPGDTNKKYTLGVKEDYTVWDQNSKSNYDSNFINTFVTVKNSVFEDAGIFAVGMDSHFAGAFLHSGENSPLTSSYGNVFKGWKNLAKTSYGAKLTLLEEVKFYNWNDIRYIDSSTLIEINESNNAVSSYKTLTSLDVKALIEHVASNPSTSDIVTPGEGEDKYIHAGIVFFGGGKNYSVVDYENKGSLALNHYTISLANVDKEILQYAAGEEPFYFYMYNNTSNFKYQDQINIIASGKAYDCINK